MFVRREAVDCVGLEKSIGFQALSDMVEREFNRLAEELVEESGKAEKKKRCRKAVKNV